MFQKILVSFGMTLALGMAQCTSEPPAPAPTAGKKIKIEAPPIELKEEKTPEITSQDVQVTPLGVPEIPKTAEEVPYQPTVVKPGMAVSLLIDASGSMNGLLGAETKWSMVLSLLDELLGQWEGIQDPPIFLSARTFGSQFPVEENQCEDSRLLFAPAPIDRKRLTQKLSEQTAQGKSPIAFALQQAAKDLEAINEDKVILLLADGKDNCGQDACLAAQQLHQSPAKVVTHVVAFDIQQEEEAGLRCIADSANGVFLLARTKEELLSRLDEALRSTIPYNLRLKTLVGATPLPTTITVYRAGTQEVVRREASFGIELFRLPAGSYDILVEYADSVETRKPSKILKGVALTETGKAEQEIRFDLASLTLSARNAQGELTETEFLLYESASQNKAAEFTTVGETKTFFVQPGQYDLIAQASPVAGQPMTLREPNITVSQTEGYVHHFAFQTGTLILKGFNSQKEPVPLVYHVTRQGELQTPIAEGLIDRSGGKIELPPGIYDITVEGQDPLLQVQPKGLLQGIAIEGGSILEKEAVLIVGLLQLTAQKADGRPVPVDFQILTAEAQREIAKLPAAAGKAEAALPPGKYHIQASFTDPIYADPPKVRKENIEVAEGKTIAETLTFELGTIKVLGRNAKEQRLQTQFTVYKGGTEQIVAQAGPNEGWFEFAVAPGNYDVQGLQTDATAEPKPHVWIRDLQVTAGGLLVHEAVFTSAKLKLIGRGTNNEIVSVAFRVYEYGHDRPLIAGTTSQEWQTFDLEPGQYYIEASYLDNLTDQTLKKWITLKVGENEFVEKELRF